MTFFEFPRAGLEDSSRERFWESSNVPVREALPAKQDSAKLYERGEGGGEPIFDEVMLCARGE